MTSFRIKQIGLAICLMMSLVIGHASACTCSHHAENKAVESNCRSHRESTETVEVVGDGNVCDADCTCSVEQPLPFVASNSPSKGFKASDQFAKSEQALADVEFRAIAGYVGSSPELVNDVSFSTTLKALLPSRAPPRL